MTEGRVVGKVAMVTGGAGGIGGATARALSEEGAAVAVVDIDGDGAAQVVEVIEASGGTAMSVEADLSKEGEVAAAIGSAVAQFGRLDVLHNNAALTDSDFLTRDTKVTDLSVEIWERAMVVNLRSQMLTCKHAIPEMVKNGGGSIVNMSSGASLKGDRTRTAYGVSKGGVNTLTMYVAAGHGKAGRPGQHDRARTHPHRCRAGSSDRGHGGWTRSIHPHALRGQSRGRRQPGGFSGIG